MSRVRVVVLMGGVSSEHEVSLKSGQRVAQSFDSKKYEIVPVTIHKNGMWEFLAHGSFTFAEAIPRLEQLRPDVIFPALHGPFGEDGRIQGLLDLLGIPYVGSGCAASALAMDKIRAKAVVQAAGIRVPAEVVVEAREWYARPTDLVQQITSRLGFPCVAKSPCQGSSLGMGIVHNEKELDDVITSLLDLDNVVLVEEFVAGTEVTCSVLDVEAERAPRPLPVTEILPVTSHFFDYHAKYTPGACREITPARISPESTTRVQKTAVRVHRLIGCAGFSRSDMILQDGEPVWLEINTLPGMTETSLFPQAAAAVGISYAQLVELLVQDAQRRGCRMNGSSV